MKGAIICSYKIEGGGNQSGKKLAEIMDYDFVNLHTDEWKECKAKKQIWYMNDDIYKLQDKSREQLDFFNVLKHGEDIKIVLNFVMANTWKDDWILDHNVSKIIFLNKGRVQEWNKKTANTRHNLIDVECILPPINLERFEKVDRQDCDVVRIGRHSRISLKFPDNPCLMYRELNLPYRSFDFMLAHKEIEEEFKDHNNFTFYKWNEIKVEKFLENIDIYLAILNKKTKEQGGRSNMEAMASGCCVIVEDRDGMQDYIKHGETGFLVKSEDEAVEIINNLDRGEIKRIGENARKYAFKNFKTNNWIKSLS